jgi:hypothetical protein
MIFNLSDAVRSMIGVMIMPSVLRCSHTSCHTTGLATTDVQTAVKL